MKTSIDSFTNCELSDSELELVSGGKCPCPDDPGGTSFAGNTTVYTETLDDGTVIYYYVYYW